MPEYQLTLTVVGKDEASSVFNAIGRSLERIGEITAGMLLSRLILAATGKLAEFAASAVNAAAQFQFMQIGLEGLVAREMSMMTDYASTIAEVYPKAQVAAKGLMDELAKISILSPYTVEAVQQVFKLSVAFGFTTDQAKRMTAGLLNMAAGIGATQEMLQRMAYNLSQINLQGKVTKLDIRQLALAGLDLVAVLRYVGKEMGINIQTHLDFNKAIESGQITWEQFSILFAKYADENFGGAAERMSRTLLGLRSTWHDIWVLTIPKMLLPAVEAITNTLGKVLDVLINVRESGHLEVIGEVWGKAVTTMLVPINTLIDALIAWQDISAATTQVFQGTASIIMGTGPAVDAWAQSMVGASGEMVNLGIKSRGLAFILTRAFGPDKAKAIADTFFKVSGILGKIWDYIGGRLIQLKQSFSFVWSGITTVIEQEGGRIWDAIKRIFAAFGLLGEGSGDAVFGSIVLNAHRLGVWIATNGDNIATFFENLATNIEKAVGWIKKMNFGSIFDAFSTGGVTGAIEEVRLKVMNLFNLSPDTSWGDLISTELNKVWESLDKLTGGKLGDFISFLKTDAIPAVKELFGWFKEHEDTIIKVATAFAVLATAFTPLAIGLKPLMGGLGGLTTGLVKLIPVIAMAGGITKYLSLAFSMAKMAFVLFLGISVPVIAILAAIGAAVGIFVAMFMTNFGGFRDFLFAAWAAIQPLLVELGNLFAVTWQAIGIAVQRVWQDILAPALKGIGWVLQNVVFPVILLLVQYFVGRFIPAAQQIAAYITDKIIPVFQTAGQKMSPLTEFIKNILLIVFHLLRLALEGIWAVLSTYVIPMFTTIWKILKEKVWPAIVDVAKVVWENLVKAFEWLKDKILGPLAKALQPIVDLFKGIYDWVKKLVDMLAKLKIPKDLEQGSPSPFEQSLMDTASMMDSLTSIYVPNLNKALGSIDIGNFTPNMSPPSSGGRPSSSLASGRSVTVNVNASVSSQVDVYRMAYQISSVIKGA